MLKGFSGTAEGVVRKSIMRLRSIFLLASAFMFAGCGGGGDNKTNQVGRAEVSGVVFDQNGNVVRNATVFFNDDGPTQYRQTVTNSNGAYILKDVPALDNLIQCQIIAGGTTYLGQNLARLYDGERTMTVNIGLYPQNQLAAFHGTVSDTHGNLLTGAKIFAIPTSGATLTSAYGITDKNGAFYVGGLQSGVPYTIQVNGLGFDSAFDNENFTSGQNKQLNFSLPTANNLTLAPPSNVFAISYTAPGQATSRAPSKNALAIIKKIVNPGRIMRPMVASRSPGSGNPVEVDVSWTPISNSSLLGYGIYFGVGSKPLISVDLLRDPLASAYEDMDASLVPGQTYTYAVTTISTGTSSTSGESNQSAQASVTPLGALNLNGIISSTQPTFKWLPASGASSYAILLFDTYPDIEVGDIFDNLSSKVSGTSYQYTGPALVHGSTYYYVVVGFSTAGNQSISQVGQFTVP